MQSIKKLCQILNNITGYFNKSENTTALFVEGAYSDASETLYSIYELAVCSNQSLAEFITLYVDEEHIDILDFSTFYSRVNFPAEYKFTLDTKKLVQSRFSGNGDIDEYLFSSIEAFESSWIELGLLNPLSEGVLTSSRNTRIHVCGLKSAFGGPQLAVVPVQEDFTSNSEWLGGSSLPAQEDLLKQVHLVSKDNIHLDPRSVQLTWGDIVCDAARPFRFAYAQHLLVSLSSIFYSVDKVVFKGVKHIETSIKGNERFDIDRQWLKALEKSVVWCYSLEDPDVPIQLFIDRLSLEQTDENLLRLESNAIVSCLEQAKSNYKYVVAKKSDAYRKELKEIFSDIKTVTDKFSEKAASLSSELLKSLMAIAFMFTIGTMSKAIVMEELFHSKEAHLLFKIIGIYLICSFFIRWLNASSELRVASNALNSWAKKLHNHIPTTEVTSLLNKQTRWSRYFYVASLAVVTAIQGTIALAAFYIEGILWYLNL